MCIGQRLHSLVVIEYGHLSALAYSNTSYCNIAFTVFVSTLEIKKPITMKIFWNFERGISLTIHILSLSSKLKLEQKGAKRGMNRSRARS